MWFGFSFLLLRHSKARRNILILFFRYLKCKCTPFTVLDYRCLFCGGREDEGTNKACCGHTPTCIHAHMPWCVTVDHYDQNACFSYRESIK